MQIITSTDALQALVQTLGQSPFITVDTEFVRESTYWPRLCLVQLASAETEAIVDPLADGLSLDPLFDLLSDTATLKVFHAARQDIEIFYHLSGRVPDPLFDTQIAAMVCGYGDQVAYDTLVRDLTGEQIDKTSRFTDWARRPLSQKQLDYALADVTHLRDVYAALSRRLEATGRTPWVAEELATLTSEETYRMDPDAAWLRLKARSQNRRFLATLREIAAWREHEAQRRDMPRQRILRDEAIGEIAANAPEDIEALGALRAVPKGIARGEAGAAILKAVARARALPNSDLPEPPAPRRKSDVPAEVLELLKVLLRIKSDQHDVAGKLIASSADLERLALDDAADIPALKGWRREVFGTDALELKHGRLLLGLAEGRLFYEPRKS